MFKSTGKQSDGIVYLRQRFADALSTHNGSLVAEREYGVNLDDLIDENIDDIFRMRLFSRIAAAVRNPINGLTDLKLNELELRHVEEHTVEVITYCTWQGKWTDNCPPQTNSNRHRRVCH